MAKHSNTTVSTGRKTILGRSNTVVEIGNNWLKVATCRSTGSGGIVNQVHCVNLAELDDVSAGIDKLFTDLKLSRRGVTTYIPRHLVTVRIIRVPSTEPEEIARMVHLQAGRQTPYSKEEVVSGYSVIDTDEEGYARILMVIARRNIISERVEALKKAGIEIARIGLSSEGVCSGFQISRKKLDWVEGAGTVAVVDIDSNSAEFSVIHDGRLVFTRHILIGASQFIDNGDRWYEQFTKEIGNSTELYRNEYQERPIEAMAVTGASAVLDATAEVLETNLDFPVQPVEFNENFKMPESTATRIREDWNNVSITPLLGAGASPGKLFVDLAPPEFHLEARMLENRNQLSVLGVLVVFILTMISLQIVISFYNRHSALRTLDQYITGEESGAQQARMLKEQTDTIKKHLDCGGAPVVIFTNLFDITPDDVYLLDLGIQSRDQIRIRGRGGRQQSSGEFVKRLDASPLFKNVQENYNNGKNEGGLQFYEFELVCAYNPRSATDEIAETRE
jgi:Tfp pilus assembly PilM family ATPase